MNEAAADAALARLLAAPRGGCSNLLDSRPLMIDPAAGFARIAFTAGTEFCDENGHLLVGLQAAMLDEAMAIAAVAQRDYRQAVPTLAMQVSSLQPVGPGGLTAEARVLRGDAELAFLQAELRHDDGGGVCARAGATARFTARSPL